MTKVSTKKSNGIKPVVISRLTSFKLLEMLIEWHEATEDYKGNYNDWWKKYPYSLNNVVKMAKEKLNS